MNMENKDREPFQTSQQGTGSAENIGQDRDKQQQMNSRLNAAQRENIGNHLGTDKNRITNLNELGMLSGRDDFAGGSGDHMENEDTGKGTDR